MRTIILMALAAAIFMSAGCGLFQKKAEVKPEEQAEEAAEPGKTETGIEEPAQPEPEKPEESTEAEEAGKTEEEAGEQEPLKAPEEEKAPETAGAPVTHTVVKGDTLYSLGKKYGVPWQEIAKANNIDETAVIKVGQKLAIPKPDGK